MVEKDEVRREEKYKEKKGIKLLKKVIIGQEESWEEPPRRTNYQILTKSRTKYKRKNNEMKRRTRTRKKM